LRTNNQFCGTIAAPFSAKIFRNHNIDRRLEAHSRDFVRRLSGRELRRGESDLGVVSGGRGEHEPAEEEQVLILKISDQGDPMRL
jgi:hypothetical protein